MTDDKSLLPFELFVSRTQDGSGWQFTAPSRRLANRPFDRRFDRIFWAVLMAEECFSHAQVGGFTIRMAEEPFIVPPTVKTIRTWGPNSPEENHKIAMRPAIHVLTRLREENLGAWYRLNQWKYEGWLGPELLAFFGDYPRKIFFDLRVGRRT